MRTINLYGELGEKFGKSFELDVLSPSEAIRALCAIIKGFEEYLLKSEKNGIGFKVFDSEKLLSEKELILRSSGNIKIVPVIGGANAETRILIGTVLVAASTYFTGGAATFLMGSGASFILGGAVEIIAGKPRTPDIPEKPENKPSYIFSGAVNTTAQGHPVPLGYGRMIVGSAVISASMDTQNLKSGYVTKVRETYQDTDAPEGTDHYTTPPKPGYHKREIIGSRTLPFFGTMVTWITYRFYYWETYLELAVV